MFFDEPKIDPDKNAQEKHHGKEHIIKNCKSLQMQRNILQFLHLIYEINSFQTRSQIQYLNVIAATYLAQLISTTEGKLNYSNWKVDDK